MKRCIVKINYVVELLSSQPITSSLIFAEKYWNKKNLIGGGGFFTWVEGSNAIIDNGNFFSSSVSSTGRWQRIGFNASIRDYGAIGQENPIRTDLRNGEWVGANKELLSDVFKSVDLARAWYPLARIVSLSESINSAAIQQCIESNIIANIPVGSFWINRSIEYRTQSSIIGTGSGSTQILVESTAGCGLTPKIVPTDGLNEIYKYKTSISGISFTSNSIPSDYGVILPNTVDYDITKSGFYLPKRTKIKDPITGLLDEAVLKNPLMLYNSLNDLDFNRFAGDGMYIGNIFSCKVSNISANQNKGWGITYFSGNTSKLQDSYIGSFNSLGGYNLPNGGVLDNCNGLDSFEENTPWCVVGILGDVQGVKLTISNSNLEGSQRLIEVHGDGSRLDMYNCTLQPYVVNPEMPPIRVFGGVSSVNIKSCYLIKTGNSTATPKDYIWIHGGGSQLTIDDSGNYITQRRVDTNGNNIYGSGVSLPVLSSGETRIATYAEIYEVFEKLSANKILIGTGIVGDVDEKQMSITTSKDNTIQPNGSIRLYESKIEQCRDGIWVQIGV